MRSLSLAALLCLSACDGGMQVQGRSEGHTEGKLAVRWGEAGSGLVYGGGRVAHGAFWVRVEDRPPAAAFRSSGIALGTLVLVDDTQPLRLGAPIEHPRGTAGELLIVYRDPSVDTGERWSAFPVGLSCARPSEDGVEPASCDSAALTFY